MANEEFQVVVRKQLGELEAEVRKRYGLKENQLSGTYVEDGALVFVFGPAGKAGGAEAPPAPLQRRKRKRGSRNRTRTRGWKKIATITSKLGQPVAVYDVFLTALKGKQLNRGEQRKAVSEIMRQNGNEPTREQVDYFLDNTLEYIASNGGKS